MRFGVLGPGLVVPTAENAANGRAVDLLGLPVFVIKGVGVCQRDR